MCNGYDEIAYEEMDRADALESKLKNCEMLLEAAMTTANTERARADTAERLIEGMRSKHNEMVETGELSLSAVEEFNRLKEIQRSMQKFAQGLNQPGPYRTLGLTLLRIANGEDVW